MNNKQQGFTLVELIVVLVIITVLIGIFASNFYNYQETKTLQSALISVRSYFNLVRQNSVSVLVPPSPCAATDFKGYGLNFDASTEEVTRTYYCPNVVTQDSFDISRHKHIGIRSVTANGIYFAKITGEVLTPTQAKTSLTLTLENTFTNQCAELEVNEFGIIITHESVSCI